jgi:hypothetical protein
MKFLIYRILGGKNDFEKIFRQNEFAALANQKGRKTLLWLAVIIGITLAALAYGIGSLQRLEARMASPFSNLVDMGIYFQDYDKVNELRDTLNNTDLGEKMGLDTISVWYKFPLNFHPAGNQIFNGLDGTKNNYGRTVDFNSNLFKSIFSGSNIVAVSNELTTGNEDLNYASRGGIVVTEKLLLSLGYPASTHSDVLKLAVYDRSALGGTYFLPVLGVVESLPSRCEFLASKHFFQRLFLPTCIGNRFPFVRNKNGDNNLYYIGPTDEKETLSEHFKSQLPAAAIATIEQSEFLADPTYQTSISRLILEHEYVYENTTVSAELTESIRSNEIHAIPYNRLEIAEEACGDEQPQRISFLFSDLSQIRNFRTYLLDRWGLELPYEVIENRENFAMVSTLGYSLGAILLLFSFVSVWLFLRSTIEGHLAEVKPNLGTFKAFGLGNDELLRHYRIIILTLLLLSGSLGFGFALGVGLFLKLTPYSNLFNLLHPIVLVALGLLVTLTVLFSRKLMQNILLHTPGDLVYGRDK